MSDLRLMSWNGLDSLNSEAMQQAVIEIEPDIAVIPEAAKEEDGITDATVHAFSNAGYDLYPTNYDDDDGRKDRHVLAMLVKREVALREVHKIRLSGRTALRATLQNGVDVAGLHLDDRREVGRVLQAQALLTPRPHRGLRPMSESAIAAGDLNALHGDDRIAKVLRYIAPYTLQLPYKDPGEPQNKLQRFGSLSRRTASFAEGKTMNLFTQAGFIDADPTHRPTMKKILQNDHILYRGNIEVVDPTVVEKVKGVSDHNRIRATLQLDD